MKNYIKKGDVIDIVLAADTLPGVAVQVGSLVVVTQVGGLTGDTVSALTTGVVELPKTAAQAQAQGIILYWDNTTKKTTNTDNSGANVKLGYAYKAAAGADAVSTVMLLP